MKIRSTTTNRRTTTVRACGLMLMVAGVSAATASAMATNRWFVRADAPTNGDGMTWETAFRDLQTALAGAAIDDEIWVARGTYRPGKGGDRLASFVIPDGVDVYGGFVGTELSLVERNVLANPTILSGDLQGNDGANFSNRTDNSYHVVRIESVLRNPRLDGFTISGGYANGNLGTGDEHGAGVLATDADFTIANCTVIDNWASGAGGGVYLSSASNAVIESTLFKGNTGGGLGLVQGSSAMVSGTDFTQNTDQGGGAIRSFNSELSLTDCVLADNTAEQFGGAIYSFEGELTLIGASVSRNRVTAASASGGGINLYDTVALIESSDIRSNSATGDGGGIAVWHFSEVTLNESAVYLNTSNDDGGGIAVWDGASLSMVARQLSDNMAVDLGGGLFVDQDGTAILDDVDVAGNSAFRGGGTQVDDGSVLTLANSWYASNVALDTGGAVNVENGGLLEADSGNMTSNRAAVGGAVASHPGTSFDIEGMRLSNNEASIDGGAIFALESTPKLRNNRLWINRALNGNGGAMAVIRAQGVEITGNAFSQNRAAVGGALYGETSNLKVLQCTFGGNAASVAGAAIALDSSAAPGRLDVDNSILWNGGDEVANLDGSQVKFSFSMVEGGGFPGLGMISQLEPTFVNAAAHDLMLAHGSPGIDAGDNSILPADLETDAAGNPRQVDDEATGDRGRGRRPIVDMGAYETPSNPLGNQFMISVFPSPLQTRDPQAIFVDFGRPGEAAVIVYSWRKGVYYLADVAVFLDIANPFQIGQTQPTDEEGTSVWVVNLPSSAAGRTVYLQAFQYGLKSNLLEMEIVR